MTEEEAIGEALDEMLTRINTVLHTMSDMLKNMDARLDLLEMRIHVLERHTKCPQMTN